MVKQCITFVTILLLSTALFAATPTGTVSIGYNGSPCPQTSFVHLSTVTLDGNGNYNLGSGAGLAGLAPGTYCFEAVYSGDANFNGSTGYVNLVVTTFSKQNTSTTMSIVPNPLVTGQDGTINGGVSGQ